MHQRDLSGTGGKSTLGMNQGMVMSLGTWKVGFLAVRALQVPMGLPSGMMVVEILDCGSINEPILGLDYWKKWG